MAEHPLHPQDGGQVWVLRVLARVLRMVQHP
jgi:hypothetical protein